MFRQKVSQMRHMLRMPIKFRMQYRMNVTVLHGLGKLMEMRMMVDVWLLNDDAPLDATLICQFQAALLWDPIEEILWQACRCYNERGFNSAMKKIQEFKPIATEWLMKIDVSMWTRHAFPIDLKNDHVTNNIAKPFNTWIGEFGGKPVTTLLEGVRTKVMSMVHKRHKRG
ncbi:UNVERIFIED_CONTAM: hypothetical protein Sradi_3952500 [Sesamum radiatum]|uniref:Uncharacterized protein n=1 Tax=Sesamum radiatum TaxID=300843 RepID=A0AAW2PKK0_SESRA